MNQPLNPTLYHLLERSFGPVRIENAGEPGLACIRLDPVTLRPRSQAGGGEQYVVRCPFCGDSRGHLYFCHRYGDWDEQAGSDNTHLVYCFRRDCHREPGRLRELRDMVFSVGGAGLVPAAAAAAALTGEGPASGLRRADPPGHHLFTLSSLAPDHPTRAYLESRGFDVAELERLWGVAWCVYPVTNERMLNRIYVPVVMGGELVGWQGRYPAELDWKTSNTPKYYNAPRMPKNQLLYNFDLARRQPAAVVVEGVTDAWRVGPCAVALFGKSASDAQVRLLVSGWYGKPIVVLLDADAAAEAEGLRVRLARLHTGGLAVVRLPDGLDPGVCPRGLLWELLVAEAAVQGVDLSEVYRSPSEG
jgi:hypothetical protein